ncbi:DUF4184 family protein [Algoriphagus winogradskyi]|uniref:DUF4184 family protein n=1 Tax=Algoriphagus winogradskyi TaxID=237017 RepID=A0ABY1NGL8_9BACT|nr:DUF4184 family protein [Algoriphagus winogradskyi]SMP08266.1 protein of unknown function [Algoriphagus winogradskyi]
MPFTFSHPAAILPFTKPNKRLSQTGLVIGSLVPDLEFYFKLKLGENIGHTLPGVILFDLPVALLVAFLFHGLVKKPLYNASPAKIQMKVAGQVNLDWNKFFTQNWMWVVMSITIGIATHLILDGMTHYDGWVVALLPLLQHEIFTIAVYDLLQYGLSVLGLVMVARVLISLESMPEANAAKFGKNRFWILVSIGFTAAILSRIYLFPEFISFWDVFMMCVGGLFYGLIFAALILRIADNSRLSRHSKSNKLINSRGTNPGFKSRALLIEKNEFLGKFGQGIVQVNDFIDKPQIVVGQVSDVQVNQICITGSNFWKSASEKFSRIAFSLTSYLNFKRGFVFSCDQKFADLNIHMNKNLKKYINSPVKLILFLGLISMPLFAFGQSEALDPAKREGFIQEATQLRSKENYVGAIAQLDSILVHNPLDAQILLFKGDLCLQNQDFAQAVEVYSSLVPLEFESTIVRVNLSYALFMSKKPSKALEAAYSAWNQDQENKSAVVNYFNALLWNVKTKDAEAFLNDNAGLVDEDQVLVMKARLYTTGGAYTQGQLYYDSLIQRFPKAPYIQEFTEVLAGKKQWDKAAKILNDYEDELSDSQKEKLGGLLSQGDKQIAGIAVGYFADVAKNTRTEQSIFWQNQLSAPLQVNVRAGANQVKAPEGQLTKTKFIAAGVGINWSQALQSSAEIVAQQVSPEEGDSFTGVTGKFETKYQPNDRRMVGLTYSSEILNFTADLLGKDIRSQSLGYVTHIMFGGKTGFFSQGNVGFLNDQNSRLQFFGSVYRLLRTEPTLKTGLNFSALSFSDSETTLYFAPDQFLSTEVFVDYSTPLPLVSKMALKIQAAAGLQQIEKRGWDPSFRAQAEINYRVNGFDFGLNGQFSNVAAASGTGYSFHYITLKVLKSF